jgi:hypothetical protein
MDGHLDGALFVGPAHMQHTRGILHHIPHHILHMLYHILHHIMHMLYHILHHILHMLYHILHYIMHPITYCTVEAYNISTHHKEYTLQYTQQCSTCSSLDGMSI